MSSWIKIDFDNKIKIDLYFKNPFWELLFNKDKKYSYLAQDYAKYLNDIKDDIDIVTLEDNENIIKDIIKYLEATNLSIDYIKKKYNCFNKHSYIDKIDFPVLWKSEEIKDYELLFKFDDNIVDENSIPYDTYILPFLLPIKNSVWNIKWTILWFTRKSSNDSNLNTIYDKFIYLNNKNLNKDNVKDFWRNINKIKIFNNLDLFCDYRYFDIDLIEKYSKEFEYKKEQIENQEYKKEQINFSNFINFIKSFIKQKWIENILMNYKNSIDWNNNNFSSHNREQCILWLAKKDELEKRDNRRYFTWSVPYANYIFNNFLNTEDKFPELKSEILNQENPLISKYNNISKDNNLTNLEKKFKFITEYINEVSHAEDAAWIWWMSWATDFLQLYKYVMIEEIIKEEDRNDIIKQLFTVLKLENSTNVDNFIKNYDDFIDLLKKKNTNDDKRLSRLYNRLYFIFSFILNNQNPEKFPIYFSATRNTMRVFWIEWYQDITKIYKDFLWKKEFNDSIDIYLKWVWENEEKYSLKDIFPLDDKLEYIEKNNKQKISRKDLFTIHAKYRFFQDLCWVLNRNVLDGQDFVNNLWKWKIFNFEILKNKIYTFENKDFSLLDNIKKLEENWDDEENKKITFWEIININYLTSEWYIKEISPWEYEVIKVDDYYIWKIKSQQWIYKNPKKI